jgi:hypothetical protein
MILSDIGYASQSLVPLYVRNTLMEKEGTSQHGDPTQEELSKDRRYSHYIGRPLIRFNPPTILPSVAQEEARKAKELVEQERKKKEKEDFLSSKFLKNDLSALNESFNISSSSSALNTSTNLSSSALVNHKDNVRKELTTQRKKEKDSQNKEETTHRGFETSEPLSNSMVRLVFKKEPDLKDLKYLDDEY